MPDNETDTPLSITASIAGILTFLAAVAAALYVRFTYLRNADTEYFKVKASLSWYKTESTFMHDLLLTTGSSGLPGPFGVGGNEPAKEMYSFVVEDLARLEARLLEVVEEAEVNASGGKEVLDWDVDGGSVKGKKEKNDGWTIIPRGVMGKTDIAFSWLPVRARALELVRQRDALGSRVLFAQMSMISSRVKAQEDASRRREDGYVDRLDRLEKLVHSQHEKLDRLEGLVHRVMHRRWRRNGVDSKKSNTKSSGEVEEDSSCKLVGADVSDSDESQ